MQQTPAAISVPRAMAVSGAAGAAELYRSAAEGLGVLTGSRPPTPVLYRVAEAAMLAAHVFPFLLMGGGLTLVGLLAVGPRRKDSPELWICLPAGLALLGTFAGLAYWLYWRLPRLAVTRFAFDGAEVVVEVPARGCVTRPIEAVRSVAESRGRRGVLGWWLRLDGVGSVFLHVATPNAWGLVEQLKPQVSRTDAEPGAAPDTGRM